MEMVNLTKENVIRKVDSLGRISIPKGLRDRMEIGVNEELEFFILETDEGETYICMTNHKHRANRYEMAAAVLDELGLELPDELISKL